MGGGVLTLLPIADTDIPRKTRWVTNHSNGFCALLNRPRNAHYNGWAVILDFLIGNTVSSKTAKKQNELS